MNQFFLVTCNNHCKLTSFNLSIDFCLAATFLSCKRRFSNQFIRINAGGFNSLHIAMLVFNIDISNTFNKMVITVNKLFTNTFIAVSAVEHLTNKMNEHFLVHLDLKA